MTWNIRSVPWNIHSVSWNNHSKPWNKLCNIVIVPSIVVVLIQSWLILKKNFYLWFVFLIRMSPNKNNYVPLHHICLLQGYESIQQAIYTKRQRKYMNFLEEKIIRDGVVKQGNVLKIDNFLNHQLDINIIRQIASELKRRFKDAEVNKILTIEASGIAIATMMGHLYDVPVVFAKKGETANSTDDKYMSQAYSFTHKRMNNVFVSKPYLQPTDKVLIVDDFLADGQAVHALIDIVHQAGAKILGIGVAVEKGQQKGGRILRDEGFRVESIAIIEEMNYETQTIRFL